MDFLLRDLRIQNNMIEAAWRCGVKGLLFLGSSSRGFSRRNPENTEKSPNMNRPGVITVNPVDDHCIDKHLSTSFSRRAAKSSAFVAPWPKAESDRKAI